MSDPFVLKTPIRKALGLAVLLALAVLPWSASAGPANGGNTVQSTSSMGGFGLFNVQGADSAGTGGITSPLIFELGDKITIFPANSNSYEFAAHVHLEREALVAGQTARALIRASLS